MDEAADSRRMVGGDAASRPTYRFGAFELDLLRYELRRGTRRLHLAGCPMGLLVLLVERRGELVNRKEIAARLWPQPGLLDVDQGINTAVRRIREALGDDPVKPRFIETVVGKGYRLIVEVTESAASHLPAPPIAPPANGQEPMSAPQVPDPSKFHELPGAAPVPKPEATSSGGRIAAFAVAALLLLVLIVAGVSPKWRRPKPNREIAGTLEQVTTNDSEQRITAAAISPDGRWLAYADVTGITLKVLQGGDTQQLKSPQGFRAEQISWFPGQLKLLISGFMPEDSNPQIWIISVSGAVPRLFRKDARNGVPSPAGRQILFTTNHDTEIWTAGIEGERSKPLVVDKARRTFPVAFWSADGKRVSYIRRFNSLANGDYESADSSSGKLLFSRNNTKIASACPLLDGRIVLINGEPSSADAQSLWTVNTDRSTGAILSDPKQLVSLKEGSAFAVTCSEDGSKISTVLEKGPPHVFVGDLQRGSIGLSGIQRLTFDTRTDYPHAWLQDNETVIFESDRSGVFQIYKQRLQDRIAEKLETGTEPAVLPQVTPDGKWILYAVKPKVSPSSQDRLFRIPVSGGTPVEVETGGPLEEFECPLSGSSGCVIRESKGTESLIFYALDPLRGKGRELARTPWLPHVLQDWCVSPDGSAVAFTSHGYGHSKIRILPLDEDAGHHERELEVVGFIKLSGISWSADGRGWYVAANSGTGTSLLYVGTQGDAIVLRDTPMSTWGVPSRNGEKLAFVDQAVDSNVWVWTASSPLSHGSD